MSTNKLPVTAHIGLVSLTVADLERSVRFYEDHLGFRVHNKNHESAVLGAGKKGLLELVENKAAIRVGRTTGLYHFAVLVPSRYHLALSLRQLSEMKTPLQGFADHLVSEAIYLADPDGNGIEIYRDRKREEWPFSSDGELQMANAQLDIEGIMGELGNGAQAAHVLDEETTIGHIHLHVSNLENDERFYTQGVGFDRMMNFGSSATFLSAGGYHHHLGINTWVGAGAPPPPENAIGLRWYEIVLPSRVDLDLVETRLSESGMETERNDANLEAADFSKNRVKFVLAQNAR